MPGIFACSILLPLLYVSGPDSFSEKSAVLCSHHASSSFHSTSFALPSSWLLSLAEDGKLFTAYFLYHLVKDKVLKVSIFILRGLSVLPRTKKSVG